MKRADKIRREAENTMRKIREIAKHIRNVEDNCLTLGEKLIEKGEIELGKTLVANGMIHDASKFYGIEFEYLSLGNPNEESAKLKMKLAIHHHNSTNSHHPEFWGNIHNMPRVAVGEMVADWKSRSEEFGTDLRQWVELTATARFGFTKNDSVYKEIHEFIDLLCTPPFEQIK